MPEYLESLEPCSMKGLLLGMGGRLFKAADMQKYPLHSLFEQLLLEQSKREPGFRIRIDAIAISIFVLMARTGFADKSLVTDRDELLLNQILHYISIHYGEAVTSEKIAEEFSISHSKLSKLFRERIGISCYQWIIERRLSAATRLLLQNYSPKEIWQQCGFPDYSSFYRLFKKFYQLSPKEYRDQVRKPSP